VPVVGGNVSLYNETEAGPIYPTPVVGMVGEVPDPAAAAGLALAAGDAVAVVGPFAPSLAGSELAKLRGRLEPGLAGVDVAACAGAITAVRDAVRAGELRVAHDISDGGLACALAECAIAGEVGVEVELGELRADRGGSAEEWLFGEGSGGFILGGEAGAVEALATRLGGTVIGAAGGERLEIRAGGPAIVMTLAEAAAAWRSLGARLEPRPAGAL
jgi:phosphoribosylformylglycinamidine synthase